MDLPSPAPPSIEAPLQYAQSVMMPEIIKFLLVVAGIALVFRLWKAMRAQ